MALTNKPQDDAKAMKDEYNKGTTISFLAEKYNHSEQDVYNVVVTDATEDVAPVTQVQEQAETTAAETKKDK